MVAVLSVLALGCSDDGAPSGGDSACAQLRDRSTELTHDAGAAASDGDVDLSLDYIAEESAMIVQNQSCFSASEVQQARQILTNMSDR